MSTILYDYSDYVELLEGKAIEHFEPTPNEVLRTAEQYILMDGFPEDFFQLSTSYSHDFIMDMWSYYSVVKRDVVKKCGFRKKYCPFCKSVLSRLKNPRSYSDCNFLNVEVKECKLCGWWQSRERYLRHAGDPLNESIAQVCKTALLKQFDISDIEIPIRLLKQYLIKHPDKLNLLSSRKMELLVTDIFKDFFKGEAIHIGGPNDKGIDIIVFSGDMQYAIQVKRRLNNNLTEPVKAIREFIGAMVVGNFSKGLYVTNASKFSKPFEQAVNDVKKYSSIEFIDLYDSKRLIDVCKSTSTTRKDTPYWKKSSSTKGGIDKSIYIGFMNFLHLAEEYGRMNKPGSLQIITPLIHNDAVMRQLGVNEKIQSYIIDDIKTGRPKPKFKKKNI